MTVSVTATSNGGSGGSGSDSITIKAKIVAVATIALKDGVKDTKFVGDTLVKSDFDITTTPSGNEDMVNVASVVITPGDNVVSATCGYSHKEITLTAGVGYVVGASLTPNMSGEWDYAAATFYVDGSPGTYEITGEGMAVTDGSDPASGDLQKNTSKPANVRFSLESGSGSGSGGTAWSPQVIPGLARLPADGSISLLCQANQWPNMKGKAKPIADFKPQQIVTAVFGTWKEITAYSTPQADATLTLDAIDPDKWDTAAVSSTAAIEVGGKGTQLLGGAVYWKTLNAYGQLTNSCSVRRVKNTTTGAIGKVKRTANVKLGNTNPTFVLANADDATDSTGDVKAFMNAAATTPPNYSITHGSAESSMSLLTDNLQGVLTGWCENGNANDTVSSCSFALSWY